DVKIQVEFDPEQVEGFRLVGYENRVLAHRDFDDDSKDAGEIGAGHTVTAIYEIDPSADKAGDRDPLMQLHMRYKQPDGKHSHKISVGVRDRGEALADSSDDYRFSAAVAAFGDRLRHVDQGADMSYGQILELAAGSLGEDASCYRHQFLELVWKAGVLDGETLVAPDSRCVPGQATPPAVSWPGQEQVEDFDDDPGLAASGLAEPDCDEGCAHAEDEPFDWANFTLEVLRLLPPLLALPLFVMALGRPRRRRRG
ncbi:MAG: DUF3520 domain-containing protein, partial [Myxococcales bacterium]|nr:DUF3520 domain-containing protein [Myxococcales bacterium]